MAKSLDETKCNNDQDLPLDLSLPTQAATQADVPTQADVSSPSHLIYTKEVNYENDSKRRRRINFCVTERNK